MKAQETGRFNAAHDVRAGLPAASSGRSGRRVWSIQGIRAPSPDGGRERRGVLPRCEAGPGSAAAPPGSGPPASPPAPPAEPEGGGRAEAPG